MRARVRRRHQDEGAVLVLVLVVLMVFGLILGALFNAGSASQRSVPFVRAHLDNVYAADAGIDAGLQRLRKNSNYCATVSNPPADLALTGLANSHDVTVRCRVVRTPNSSLGAAGYAVIILSTTDPKSLTTSNGTSGDLTLKQITGPVFVSGPTDLAKPLSVHDGDVDNLCPTRSKPANLFLDDGFSWTAPCSTTQPDVAHVLPTVPCPSPPGTCASSPTGYASEDGGCQVFLPGTYTTAPVLSTSRTNYFASGVYDFRFAGAWSIKQQTVIAGSPEVAPGTAYCTNSDPTASSPLRLVSNPAIPSYYTSAGLAALPGYSQINGYGATFVFSGSAYVDMDSDGSLTINPRLQSRDPAATRTLPWTERLAVVAQKVNDGINPTWPLSSVTANVILPKSGKPTSQVIKGVYYTPGAGLEITATSGAFVKYVGGAVVDTLSLADSSSAFALQVGVTNNAGTRLVRLTSTSTPTGGAKAVTSVALVAVSSASGFPVTVQSWRSSAPDF